MKVCFVLSNHVVFASLGPVLGAVVSRSARHAAEEVQKSKESDAVSLPIPSGDRKPTSEVIEPECVTSASPHGGASKGLLLLPISVRGKSEEVTVAPPTVKAAFGLPKEVLRAIHLHEDILRDSENEQEGNTAEHKQEQNNVASKGLLLPITGRQKPKEVTVTPPVVQAAFGLPILARSHRYPTSGYEVTSPECATSASPDGEVAHPKRKAKSVSWGAAEIIEIVKVPDDNLCDSDESLSD